jgi:hypothetical protein
MPMYRIWLVIVLLALSVVPTWARGVAGHATMHRLGSNLRQHHPVKPVAVPEHPPAPVPN